MLQFYIGAGAVFVAFLLIYLLLCFLMKIRPGFKVILFAVTIITGFTLYLYGYLNTYPVSEDIDYIKNGLMALLSTIRMFIIEIDYGEISEGMAVSEWMQSPYYIIPFWVCHVLAPVTTVLAAVSVFGKRLRLLLQALIGFRKERYIIFGVNSKSLCFAGNVMTGDSDRKNKKRIVLFIDDGADAVSKDKIHNMGSILFEPVFSGDRLNKKALYYAGFNRLKLYKKIYIFAFSENEITNSIIAHQIIKYADEYEYSNKYLRGIFIHTGSDMIIDDLESKFDKLNSRKYDIRYFCEEELAVRKLFMRNPLYKCLDFDKETALPLKNGGDKPALTILILGFGVCGKQILRKAVMNGRFEGCTFNGIVFDNRMDSLEGEFKNKYPGLFTKDSARDMAFEFYHDDIGSTGFYNKLNNYITGSENDTLCQIDYIVSCTGDDYRNLDVVTDIRNYLLKRNIKKLPVIAAHISDNEYQVFNDRENALHNITIFGNDNDIFTHDIIVEEEMDRLAMMVDEIAYGGRNWAELSSHSRNSNRAVASFLGAYLHIMGFSLINGKQKRQMDKSSIPYELADDTELTELFDSLKKQAEKAAGGELTENLGATEHLRWNAFHFSNGWTVKPIEEMTDAGSRKDAYRKQHGCLVSWEELKDVGVKLHNDKYIYQKYDKYIVAKTYDIIKAYNSMDDISDDNRSYIIRRTHESLYS